MELIIFVILIVLAFAARSAHTKISVLQAQVRQLQQKTTTTAVPQSTQAQQPVSDSQSVPQPVADDFVPVPIPMNTMNQPIEPVAPIPVPLYENNADWNKPAEPFFLFTWFKEHTLIKVGSIIFFFGAAWFVSYAFDQNWIPPLMRVLMGLVLAMVIYTIGFLRRPIESIQYIVLTALGSGVVFATVLAAQFSFVQPLLPSAISLVILVVTIGYTLWVSYITDTEWLAITAAVAALFAPQFTGSDVSSAIPFFTYLFVIAAGFGAVVLATLWRYVSLTLVLGVSIYLLSVSNVDSQQSIVWFFAVLFSVLFLGLTTAGVLRSRVPLFIDGMTLLVTGLVFAYFVHTLAILPALASFVAAAVTAFIGYVARQRNVDPSAVLLYASISIVGLFAGTAYLFDGVTATFFFAIESATLVFFAMRYAFLPRTVVLATSTMAIPMLLGIIALTDAAWDTGILHAAALACATVSICFGAIGIYMYVTADRTALPWLQQLSRVILLSWYGYTVILLIVVAGTLASLTATDVLPWVAGLLLLHAVVMNLVAFSKDQIRSLVLWTYTLPVVASFGVIAQSGIEELFTISDIFIISVTLLTLVAVTVVYGLVARQNESADEAVSSYVFLWTSVAFLSFWIVTLIGITLEPRLTLLVGSVVVSALLYGVINLLLQLQVRFGLISPFVGGLLVLVFGLLPALSLQGWSDGVLSIEAVSLYVYTTIVTLLGITLYKYAQDHSDQSAKKFSTALFIAGGAISFVLVWIITHTISTTAVIAVTAALFVYTIVGLVSYVYGKRTGNELFVRAGYLLLAAVVIRLGIVDVWGMELFWRIITFLGIGALFILAALLERKPEQAVQE